MSLNNTIITQLKRFCKVSVYVGERESTTTDSVSVSPVKLDELVAMYEKIYRFTHTIWRNLPTPPDCEPALVIIWMIASENYDINHFTVSWEGVSANTFVHLWSTIDRLKNTMDSMTAYWLLGSRGPMGYAERTGMPGAADTYLYPKEIITPPHIGVLVKEADRAIITDLDEDFASFYDFRQTLMMPKKVKTIDVAQMMMRNLEMTESKTNPSG